MFLETLTHFDGLVAEVGLVRQADKNCTAGRQDGACSFLALVVSQGEVFGEAEHFTGGTHFRAENRVNLGELVKGEHSFLGAVVLELLVLQLQIFQLFTHHEAGSKAGHLSVTDLGDQRHGTGCAGVGFENENLAVFDSVLHVHETAKRLKESVATDRLRAGMTEPMAFLETWRDSAILRV